MKIIFGPVNSRRFGASLGVDLSPAHKQCNFDCVYCELRPAPPVPRSINTPAVAEVVKEVQTAIDKGLEFDFITLTANGEPTLYPHLKELVSALNLIKKDKKLLILSNGTGVLDEGKFKAMLELDVVKFSLDSAVEKTFFRVDKALKSINLAKMIDKMAEFKSIFKGQLVMEVLVVQGLNDNEAEFKALNLAFSRIKPDRVDISSIDRPSAYPVKPVSNEVLENLASCITSVPVLVARREKRSLNSQGLEFKTYEVKNEVKRLNISDINSSSNKEYKLDLSEEELLKMLALRPQSEFDIEDKFSELSKARLKNLLKSSKIWVQDLAGVSFYRA
ncbi:radical SAM protein [Campylobacter troglodytis]|uniref:radical SAM protein n=1 Tax=Campylobacter troglodytis TaxID=654363 RepID=UPI0011584997|nr:radical SAM protein [Campylobacter troglodytis]TQR60744.1 radical SAM protein [Campylobacter troglodytis]